jgi:hypothetical protein
VYNKSVPDDDFIKSKHVIKTQVFLLVVLTDKIKSIYALIIALLRGLYLGNKMDRYERPQTPLTIAFLRGLYFGNKMDRH